MIDLYEIDHLDDPRVAMFRDLPRRGAEIESKHFVVEGELLTRRLLASRLVVESILITPSRFERMRVELPAQASIFVAPNDLLRTIVGYPFHAGVLACAQRPSNPSLEACVTTDQTATLVVCPHIDNHANLGSLIRVAAAMGAEALLLGVGGCDPFRRQAVRVSMGSALTFPVRRCDNMLSELETLAGRWEFDLVAAVADADATPLNETRHAGRRALIFGNEEKGLDPAVVALAHQRVHIPMHANTDSLNVAVAAAVMLYHFGLSG